MLTVLFLLFPILVSCQTSHGDQSDVTNTDENIKTADDRGIEDSTSGAGHFGEMIYIPIYSSIFHYKDLKTYDLSATLSIHNVDLDKTITVVKVDYYNTDGELIQSFAKDKLELRSFQTVHFVIEEDDISGGTGANFLVEWVSDSEVCSPLVEAVMISTSGQQGISFTTTGKVIRKFDNK
jgi:hypothetical protein